MRRASRRSIRSRCSGKSCPKLTKVVPAAAFDAAVNGIQLLGELEQQTIRVEDVTAEWVDLEARLGAKRILEARYYELVKQAGKVSELLEVERELGKVRSDIESMEAQKRLLGDQVAMSTLTITCTVPTEHDRSFFADAGSALARAGTFSWVSWSACYRYGPSCC